MTQQLTFLVSLIQLFKDPAIAISTIALAAIGLSAWAIHAMKTIAVKQSD